MTEGRITSQGIRILGSITVAEVDVHIITGTDLTETTEDDSGRLITTIIEVETADFQEPDIIIIEVVDTEITEIGDMTEVDQEIEAGHTVEAPTDLTNHLGELGKGMEVKKKLTSILKGLNQLNMKVPFLKERIETIIQIMITLR